MCFDTDTEGSNRFSRNINELIKNENRAPKLDQFHEILHKKKIEVQILLKYDVTSRFTIKEDCEKTDKSIAITKSYAKFI
jgi:hypothetical protein